MRTMQVKVFKFDELKPEIQKKVIDNSRDINTSYDWWDWCEEGIKEIFTEYGITYKGLTFDLDYRGTFGLHRPRIEDRQKFATKFSIHIRSEQDRDALDNISVREYGERNSIEGEYPIEGEIERIDARFQEMLQAQLKMLQEEEEYLTSDESIKESLIANECEFEENGERI